MTGCLRVAGAAVLLGWLLVGCEDEKVVTATARKPSPTATATAGAAGAAPQASRPVILEEEFMESDRSRDPFRSYARAFLEEAKGQVRSQRDVVLPDYAIDELKLIGIVTRMQPAKAMLVDPTGKGYVIQRGQFVGRADLVQTGGRTGSTYEINWRVDRIRDGDVVFVREDPANPDVPSVTRVIPLRTEPAQLEK